MTEGFSTRSDILECNHRDVVANDQTESHGFQSVEWNTAANSNEQPYDCSYLPNEVHANVALPCAPSFPSSTSASSVGVECSLQDPRGCVPSTAVCADFNLLSEGHNFNTASRLFERQALGSGLPPVEYGSRLQNTSQSSISSFSAAAAVAAVAAAYMSSSTSGYFPAPGVAFSTPSPACPKSESKSEVGREAFPLNSNVVDTSVLDRFAEGLSAPMQSDMPFADCVAQAYDRVQELSMRADQYLHADASSAADDYLLGKQKAEYCGGNYSSRGRGPPVWLSETNRVPALGFQYCRNAFSTGLVRDQPEQQTPQQQPIYPHPLVGLSAISAAPGSLVRPFPFDYSTHFPPPQAPTAHHEAFISNHSAGKDRSDETLFQPNEALDGCLDRASPSTAYRKETENAATYQRMSSEQSRAKVSRGDAAQKMAHVKKPLNAFMLFMKEMRAKVVAECTMKESAAINQILGRKWHALPREEQAKFYEMARREKEIHQRLYPGWSARDNYAFHAKRRKSRCRYRSVGAGGVKGCGGAGGCNREQEGGSLSEEVSSGLVTPTTSPNSASALGRDNFHGYPFNFDGVPSFRQPFNTVSASIPDSFKDGADSIRNNTKQYDCITDYQRFQREFAQPPAWFRNPSRYDAAASRSAWFSQTTPAASDGHILPAFPYNLNGEFSEAAAAAATESRRRPTSATSEAPTTEDATKSVYRMLHAQRNLTGDPTVVDCHRTPVDPFAGTIVSTAATVPTAAFDSKHLAPSSCTAALNPYEFCCSQAYGSGGGEHFQSGEKGGDEYASIHGV